MFQIRREISGWYFDTDECRLRCYLWLPDTICVWFIMLWLLPILVLNILLEPCNATNSCTLTLLQNKWMTIDQWHSEDQTRKKIGIYLLNEKYEVLNHPIVIWQQHFSCCHKRFQIKWRSKFLYRLVPDLLIIYTWEHLNLNTLFTQFLYILDFGSGQGYSNEVFLLYKILRTIVKILVVILTLNILVIVRRAKLMINNLCKNNDA